MLRILRKAGIAMVAVAVAGQPACKSSVPPGSKTDATAMGDWASWYDLTPLVEVAESHADKTTIRALRDASELLRRQKPASADRRLAQVAGSAGRHWVSVARADLASLHFSLCIRGVAWRLTDADEDGTGKSESWTDRAVDFSEETRIEPGDVSVEALLTNLDAALASKIPALATQARIARARVAAFAQRCAANEDVAELAQRTVESDLATLAAEGHLTPDLAYLWAGVQMNRFSGSAARPFLLQAREGGFDHPAVTFMLAVIALEERDVDRADKLAAEAAQNYARLGDAANQAEALFVRGEVARARGDRHKAADHYRAALKKSPLHIPSILAITDIMREHEGEPEAIDYLHAQLPRLLLDGALDQKRSVEAAENLEALVIMATDPHIAQLSRDALLLEIDAETDPMRRGLRYFYAATLDVRLREYEIAHGHGLLARDEFEAAQAPPPVDVEAFLGRLTSG